MSQGWLHNLMLHWVGDWKPSFSLSSAINWAKAVSFEIVQQHGDDSVEQYHSCKSWFDQRVNLRNAEVPLAPVFGPLFHSLAFSITLASYLERDANHEWVIPSAVVVWYYAVYNAARSIIASYDSGEPETHGSTIRAFSSIQEVMPHPFDMVAIREIGETYRPTLPRYPEVQPYNLERVFDPSRECAQGMILQYLKGTSGWVVENVKDDLMGELRKLKLRDFRTNQARMIRDRRLPNRVNFLNCVFRYRGKANYRDSLFLTYGQRDSRLSEMVGHFYNCARFSFVCALAYADRRFGSGPVCEFLQDSSNHLRGANQARGLELFWNGLNDAICD